MSNSPAPDDTSRLDKIGDWSVDKLEILKAYAVQYSLILQNQMTARGRQFHFGYIDGFAGAGAHLHKSTGKVIPGSPLNALHLPHRFDEYHFIDLNPDRVARLRERCAEIPNVHVHHGDCNDLLLQNVFPNFRYEDYRRALCFLDPYGTHLRWEVLATAGKMKSVEIFLNFPVHDMNRNAKRRKLTDVNPEDRARMTAFWGNESWHAAMFSPSDQTNFFGQLAGEAENAPEMEKTDNEAFAAAFRKRLHEAAGFAFVPSPIPMKNSRRAIVYYLFFASNNATGSRIASHIFKTYRSP